ncbi:DUF3644 domain-containing protein [Aquiflexum gelatinilyticum]|uniref:DUF3644 domain-containing protein n=1 Tax=Aquiflexum gelatinilyticum TaxID=2961943 RepID=UPI00216A1609|nr:DUF3644 domain-containing protein [Aquiflexum gelatinilyticum]MCS4435340.1 DUF3644 domain-containing protein [Aquiflexum gelatinilyticum]
MRKEAKHLYHKAIDSLTLSIELFNRPNDCGRIHGVLIFMDHSFEMLLKASIIHKGGKIKEKGAKETIGFGACVRKGFSDNTIKFLSDTDVLTLQTINGLRDAAQHYTLEMSEQYLYFQAQAGLTLFRDIAKKVFNIDLKTQLPVRVLPLSTTPPMDIQAFFSSEVQEIKKLLAPKSRKKLEATEKLRALAIMENAIQGNESQPSDKELKSLAKQLPKATNWGQLFPSVSTLSFTQNGYGPSLDLRITKSEGVPVTVVPEGTPGAGVVAIKRVNELDFYNLGRDQLAKKLGLTGPKTTAAVKHFGVKEDPECFKRIQIGKTFFDRYSQKTREKIKDGLKTKSIEEIWKER